MPCLPPPESSTSTIVVRSHLRVPSDSGKSVGTVKVFTSMRLMGTDCGLRSMKFEQHYFDVTDELWVAWRNSPGISTDLRIFGHTHADALISQYDVYTGKRRVR